MKATVIRHLENPKADWALPEEQRSFGCLKTSRGHLPLDEIKLNVGLRGFDYSLCMNQSFVNVHNHSLEAVYIFPLPARAAVSKFRMKCQDRVVEGVLKERGAAREEYQEAIQSGRQASMVEEERPETFTMTVGNIPAGQRVTVELHLDGPLVCIDSTALFRFPLVVAPKYIPGVALGGKDVGSGVVADTDQVPDASRITPPVLLPGYPNPVRLGIEIELDSPLLQWNELRSTLPLTLASDEVQESDEVRLIYEPQPGGIDHDFILAIPFPQEEAAMALQIQESSAAPHQEWPFCLTLVPPAGASKVQVQKHVVILLDRSGSMNGWKMNAARKTVARLLRSLPSGDAFRVLAFDDQVEDVGFEADGSRGEWFKLNQPQYLCPANEESIQRCQQALEGVEARGGTEIAGCLQIAIEILRRSPKGPSLHIILVTDGQVGNERQILAQVASRAEGIRVSTIGIDRAVNAAFLESLASTSGGLCQLVQSDSELDRSMNAICQRIGNPSLRNVQVSLERGQLEVVGRHFDLYPGVVTRIYGRVLGERPELFKVRAESDDGRPFCQEFRPRLCTGTVEKIWAREWVLDKEHEFNVSSNRDLIPEITQFSLNYGVLCRFTAFLAVDLESSGPVQRRSLTQAVETPQGWEGCEGSGDYRDKIMEIRARRCGESYAPSNPSRNFRHAPNLSCEAPMCPPIDMMAPSNSFDLSQFIGIPHRRSEEDFDRQLLRLLWAIGSNPDPSFLSRMRELLEDIKPNFETQSLNLKTPADRDKTRQFLEDCRKSLRPYKELQQRLNQQTQDATLPRIDLSRAKIRVKNSHWKVEPGELTLPDNVLVYQESPDKPWLYRFDASQPALIGKLALVQLPGQAIEVLAIHFETTTGIHHVIHGAELTYYQLSL